MVLQQNESLVLASPMKLRSLQEQLNELQKFTSCHIARDQMISHRCLTTLLLSCHPEKRGASDADQKSYKNHGDKLRTSGVKPLKLAEKGMDASFPYFW